MGFTQLVGVTRSCHRPRGRQPRPTCHTCIVERVAATLFTSTSGGSRVQAAARALGAVPPAGRALIVGASRASADELALTLARQRGALFGVGRVAWSELAMKLALPALARQHRSPGGALGAEAMAARAAFDAHAAGELRYFAPVADLPGFPRAAARTLSELQLAGVPPQSLGPVEQVGPDLASLLARVEAAALQAGIMSRADVFAAAASRLGAEPEALGATDLVLLDVAIGSHAEEKLLEALLASADRVLATVPLGDRSSTVAYERAGLRADARDGRTSSSSSAVVSASASLGLARLQHWLFSSEAPPEATVDDSVQLFSAPGEGREAVEVARRVLREAGRGVRFDQMAVLLRAPKTYFGLLEHAFARAGIPAWFERGTRRPDPSGRAFLALLACADESLSARRFAEYLSLGQVPVPAKRHAAWTPPSDEFSSSVIPAAERAEDLTPAEEAPHPHERDGDRIVAGTLRAPWRWEELLVEASVIHGIDRWRRRLPGLRREYERRLRELRSEDQDSPRLAALERDREQLSHLESFAVPVVEMLDGWREPRPWGAWLDACSALAPRVLRQPARVLRVLGEMAPLGAVGPVSLRQVREVLAQRLLTLTHEPPRRQSGRMFVGTPHAARGRVFRVVFAPGLAERIFPQRLREDPLLLDTQRARVTPHLAVADVRADEERLQLRLAVGAAAERLYLSYPRLELSESRPRVPSFYVLDVMRALTGVIPEYQVLSEHAFAGGAASLAWPAPRDPVLAIDDFEHDLSVLQRLLGAAGGESAAGRARYLLDLNPALRRSVTERWLRWQRKWSYADGLIRAQPLTASALARQRLAARPYSLTALQRFTACPYQFQLAAAYRLAPLERPAPLQRLDPLTRGSLFHDIQTAFFRNLQANGLLPVTEGRVASARTVLDWAIAHVARQAYDDLAPAIDRVWHDEIDSLRRDLRVWLEGLAQDGRDWVPQHFELGFGLPDDGTRDSASTPDPAAIGPGFLLRGSIDLVERRPGTRILRVTDHKTGKNRTTQATIVDGGRVLQPVLYAVALEALTGEVVEEGRLSYCTTAGQFTTHPIKLDPHIRRRGLEVLEIIDRAIEHGMLAARPARDACASCDFRPICGPDEPRRIAQKPETPDLDALRRMQ